MSFYHLTVLGGKTASGITVCIINCISGYHGLLISYHLFCRITNALDLKEHLQKTVKKLPAGIKRKVRLSDRACMSSPAPGRRRPTVSQPPVFVVPPAVLRPEHAGQPPGHAAGRAVHRYGSQSQTAHVVSMGQGHGRPSMHAVLSSLRGSC